MRSPFGILTITCQPLLSSFYTLLCLASLIACCKGKKSIIFQYSCSFQNSYSWNIFLKRADSSTGKLIEKENTLILLKLLLVCTFIWSTAFHAHSFLKWKIEFLVLDTWGFNSGVQICQIRGIGSTKNDLKKNKEKCGSIIGCYDR